MIDFYTDGSTVGVALSGWTSIVLISYILFEYVNWSVTRLFFFRKIFIYFKVRKYINSIIPSWWGIKKISLLTMSKRKGNSNVEILFEVTYNIKLSPPKPLTGVSDILVYRNGKIISTSFVLKERIDELDNKINKVQMKRDKVLEELGI